MAVIWKVDQAHSAIQFKVKYLVISSVNGSFSQFEGQIEASQVENFQQAKVQFSVRANSISTQEGDRDEHLKSADFLDAGKYPNLHFVSTSFEEVEPHQYRLVGDLTIKAHTESVEFRVEFGGIAKDYLGRVKAGFDAEGKIDRKQFGLQWDQITEAGSVVVGDDINIMLSLQFVKQ